MTRTLVNAAAGSIVAGMCGFGSTAAQAEDPAIRTMRVLVLNPAGASPSVLAGAEAAATRVFRRAGIDTVWRAGALLYRCRGVSDVSRTPDPHRPRS